MEVTLQDIRKIFGQKAKVKNAGDYVLIYSDSNSVSSEHFAIFDSSNNPVKHSNLQLAVPRVEAHSDSFPDEIYHRGVNIFLVKNGMLYIPRRSIEKDLFPDCSDVSVSEHVKINESYESAALRGLQEELSLGQVKSGSLKHLFDLKIEYSKNKEWARYYLLEGDSFDIVLSNESNEGGWFRIENLKEESEVNKLNFRKDHLTALKRFISEY